jgi:hypothetical protein
MSDKQIACEEKIIRRIMHGILPERISDYAAGYKENKWLSNW